MIQTIIAPLIYFVKQFIVNKKIFIALFCVIFCKKEQSEPIIEIL